MERPLISIITVSYNAADVILPTLVSVATQSFTDLEHILVDGASTDDTVTLARRNGIAGLRMLSEPDRGIYDAMNKGLRLARGRYILFMNAGDAFANEFSLSRYAKAAAVDNPDIIYADTVIVDADRNVLRRRHLDAPESLTVNSYADGMLVCHQAFMVKREIAPRFNTDYRLSADYDWSIRCIEAANPDKCCNLRSVEIHYLDDGASEHHKLKSLLERFQIMREHYGLATTLRKHASFIPRAVMRHLK